MTKNYKTEAFTEAASKVGAKVHFCADLREAADYIAARSVGTTLVPDTQLVKKHDLKHLLKTAGAEVFLGNFRNAGFFPAAGVTFCNFAMADTGTIVLESTDEAVRLATMLPEIHFVIVDPGQILEDNLAAASVMAELHKGNRPRFIGYITGPSRTADIERVLTIGCHGPRELHILLVESVSETLLEN